MARPRPAAATESRTSERGNAGGLTSILDRHGQFFLVNISVRHENSSSCCNNGSLSRDYKTHE